MTVFLTISFLLGGCGGGGGGDSSTSSAPSSATSAAAPAAPVAPVVPVVPQLGKLRLNFRLAKIIPSEVQQIRVLGVTAQGAVVFGPVTVAKASLVLLENVPLSVTQVRLELLGAAGIRGIAVVPVAMVAGQESAITDPAFVDIVKIVKSIQVQAVATTTGVGLPQPLKASAIFDDGSSQDVTSSVLWSSQDTSVVSVSNETPNLGPNVGVATPLKAGQSIITAVSASCPVK